jgi:hypothetical protein
MKIESSTRRCRVRAVGLACLIVAVGHTVMAMGDRLPRVDPVRVMAFGADFLQLIWLPVDGATEYEVRVVRRGKRKGRRTIRTGETSIRLDNLGTKGRYVVKIRARNDVARGRWSPRLRANMRKLEKAFGPPRLENLLVDLSNIDAFLFTRAIPKNFVEFGGRFERTEDAVPIPAFEYFTKANVPVSSPIKGIVRELNFQADSDDYEIEIATNPFSGWYVIVDHVSDVRVRAGQKVKAGDVVGVTARYLGFDGVWRTELEVSNFTHFFCPFEHFDPETADAFKARIAQAMTAWEQFVGDDTVYDEAAMVPFAPGCLSDKYAKDFRD